MLVEGVVGVNGQQLRVAAGIGLLNRLATRFGTPDDVARTALFLCSDEASYFTGSILHPDGGYGSTFGGG